MTASRGAGVTTKAAVKAEPGRPAPKDGARAPLPLDGRARVVARTVFAVLLVLLALWVAQDFLTPVAWGGVLAITLWPIYVRLAGPRGATRSPVLAPLITTLATGILLFGPILLAAHKLGQESDKLLQGVTQLRESGIGVPVWLAQIPLAGEFASEWWRTNLADPQGAGSWFSGINKDSVAEWTKAIGGQLLHRLFMFFVTLLTLFCLLRDGPWIAAHVLNTADRLLGFPGERLSEKMVDAIRGTVTGTVVVAVVEGLIIGTAYFVAGVPSPLVFMLLTIAFAMLPFGAWFAFTAASLLLLLQGGPPMAAAGVFGFGAAVMLIGDHFVWPALVGGTARMPFLLALIGIFGGMQAFGLLGLFVGPVIMAAVLTVWREWVVAPDAAATPARS